MEQQTFSPSTDELLANNEAFVASFDSAGLQVNPKRHLTIVTCMDSRMDIFKMLGLRDGEAHIIRNAGGVVTDDVIRSLCLSQRFLGTREVLLIHHTDCGATKVEETSFRATLQDELGITPAWSTEAFTDPYADVRQSMKRLQTTPFIVEKAHIRGFVYDVDTGQLHEVTEAA